VNRSTVELKAGEEEVTVSNDSPGFVPLNYEMHRELRTLVSDISTSVLQRQQIYFYYMGKNCYIKTCFLPVANLKLYLKKTSSEKSSENINWKHPLLTLTNYISFNLVLKTNPRVS